MCDAMPMQLHLAARARRRYEESVKEELRVLRETLRKAGLRATHPRVAVLDQLARAKAAVSHGDLSEKLAARGIDRATVYRNLTDLVGAGLVRRSDMGDHVWRFELVTRRDEHEDAVHAHFLCSGCGVVACLPDDAISIARPRRLPVAMQRREVQIEVRGLCDACV